MLSKALKRIITAAFSLYAFNMILINFNIVIPINFWTILYTSFFSVPGILILLIIKIVGV